MLTLNISGELQSKLEQLARQQGLGFDELVEKALASFVENQTELPKPALPPTATLAEIIEANKKLGLPPKPPLELHAWNWTNWPTDFTFRREEIYDDDGR